jgi:hypothetical protein
MGWVVNATSQQLYPREKPGTHCIGVWVGPRAGLDGCGKSRPTDIRSPYHPVRSKSLYRLSYLGPLKMYGSYVKYVQIPYGIHSFNLTIPLDTFIL